jgi:prephenate dehydrogenase
MDVLVVGAGEMGRWIGRALDSDAPADVSLAFADADRSAATDAAEAMDAAVVDDPAAATPDAVIVAVPIPAATEAIATWGPRARQAVVDVTGTMAEQIAAMREHAPDAERTSLHPLFAAENEPGNVAVVTDADGPVSEAIRETLASRDNALYETTPTEHDEAMETVQAKAHAAVLAYALAAEEVPDELHTPVSADMTAIAEQVTGGEARVYADIQASFDGAAEVAAAARQIADADADTFEGLYEDAGR